MIYLASPYSDPNRQVMADRYYLAMQTTVSLLKQRYIVYSSIVHCHAMAVSFDLPHNFEFWQHYNKGMINVASLLYVLNIAGCKDSKGVNAEIDHALDIGLDIRACSVYGFFTIFNRSELK